MITVHNLENSQSVRILWLLEELGVEYKIQQYSRNEITSFAPEEYRKLHPVGWAPTITDGHMAIAETNAIVDYILDKYPDNTLRPESGAEDRLQYLYWFHAAQGSLMPHLVLTLVMRRMVSNVPFIIRPILKYVTNLAMTTFVNPRTYKILDYMDSELCQNQWLSGSNFSAADIVMGYCLESIEERFPESENYSNIKRYIRDFRSREAYKVALMKNGKFQSLTS